MFCRSPGWSWRYGSWGSGQTGGLAGRMPASWRADCHAAGSPRAGWAIRGAVSVTGPQRAGPQRNIVRRFSPWSRGPRSGKSLHEGNKGATEARGSERTMFVVDRRESARPTTQTRSASTSIVVGGRSCVPSRASRGCKLHLPPLPGPGPGWFPGAGAPAQSQRF